MTEIDPDGWYIVDAARPAVVSGPHDHVKVAKLEAMDHAEHAVVRGDRIQQRLESDAMLVIDLDDFRVVTDGGQPERVAVRGSLRRELDDGTAFVDVGGREVIVAANEWERDER